MRILLSDHRGKVLDEVVVDDRAGCRTVRVAGCANPNVEILYFEGYPNHAIAGKSVGVPPEKWMVEALSR